MKLAIDLVVDAFRITLIASLLIAMFGTLLMPFVMMGLVMFAS